MNKAWLIFCPFTYKLWILLFLFMLIVFVLVSIHRRDKSKNYIFFAIFGIILEKPFSLKFRSILFKVFIYDWVFGVMFLSYGYKATLLSYLTFPPMRGVRDIAELAEAVKKGSHICAIYYKGSYVAEMLMESEHNGMRAIGKSLQQHKTKMSVPEMFKSTKKKVAYVLDSI